MIVLQFLLMNMKMEKFAALGLADAYNLVDRAVSKSSLSRAKSGYISATKEVLKAERELAEAESKTTGVRDSRGYCGAKHRAGDKRYQRDNQNATAPCSAWRAARLNSRLACNAGPAQSGFDNHFGGIGQVVMDTMGIEGQRRIPHGQRGRRLHINAPILPPAWRRLWGRGLRSRWGAVNDVLPFSDRHPAFARSCGQQSRSTACRYGPL